MTIAGDHIPDEAGDDLLAAEYVLGVLPADERARVSARIDAEPEFARLVERWEGHFEALAAGYAPVEPPASVKSAIDRRLGTAPTATEAGPAGFWSSLALWRGLAFAALSGLVLAISVQLLDPSPPPERYLASLSAEDSDVRYVLIYDPGGDHVRLRHLSGALESGRDFELWVIDSEGTPVSLGVIPAGPSQDLAVGAPLRPYLTGGTTLAISLEPAGGSPTGQPTGPVVSAGALFQI
jgi:anti-sigma-K factor RskA